jgi:ribonuclease P protein subunit RPR2
VHSATKSIAKRRVQVLFEEATAIGTVNPELSRRYVASARKIAMAARIRLPWEFKRRTCKRCDTLFVYGDNCRVRVRQKREPHVVITCLKCGWQTRILLRKKVEKKIEQDKVKDEAAC